MSTPEMRRMHVSSGRESSPVIKSEIEPVDHVSKTIAHRFCAILPKSVYLFCTILPKSVYVQHDSSSNQRQQARRSTFGQEIGPSSIVVSTPRCGRGDAEPLNCHTLQNPRRGTGETRWLMNTSPTSAQQEETSAASPVNFHCAKMSILWCGVFLVSYDFYIKQCKVSGIWSHTRIRKAWSKGRH
ncbi:unnamed protein product [Enterobius vermicularis]|uniref:Uncharacterized protein n=1 Tax=Enterobius vermicularis TaxID=51028 RepID=A0A0N4VDF6_ENTVE|nr:unnamed protein product [Enterobius vermicularis]